MKVKDLIKQLEKINPELEVFICDGYNYITYHTNDILIQEFDDLDDGLVCDIGIGGCKIREGRE